MSETVPLVATGHPSIERLAGRIRITGAAMLGVVAAALVVLVLAGCSPSAGRVESHSAVSSARKVGLVDASTQYMSCAEESSSASGGARVVRATCSNRLVVCCVIPVTATYRDSTATAVSSFDASFLPGRWYRESGRWSVSCSWKQTGGDWSMSSCASPVLTG